MSDPNDGCPYCGAELAIKDLSGKPYFLCGSVGDRRTSHCKVHGKTYQELIEARDQIESLKEQLEEKNELLEEYKAFVRPGDLKHMRL